MTTTTFTNGVTLSDAGWFNDVNALTYTVFNAKATAGTSGTILVSNGTNIVNTTATYPTTVAGAGSILRSSGANAWAASTATYPDTVAGAGQILRASGANAWAASTATYPDTTTSGRFLISTGANTVSDSNRVTHDGTTFAVTGNQSLTGTLDLSGASSGQISFPATQNASAGANVLDDYEEGTWTPSLGGTATYNSRVGTYTKIGRLVYIMCKLDVGSIGTGSTTQISGLPFNSANNGFGYPLNISDLAFQATNVVSIYARTTAAGTVINVQSEVSAAAGFANNAIFGNGTVITIGGCYEV